jgi:1-phosphatidylinositol phosphodiesterase
VSEPVREGAIVNRHRIVRPLLAVAGLAALTLTLAVPGTASAQPSRSSGAFNSLTAESHPDWMAALPDGAGLGTLSIPGTHDTLAIHGGFAPWAYEAQENHGDSGATLDAQLAAGIRAIDIRVRIVDGGTAFAIHHEDVYQNANFDDVLGHARGFLAAHPTETILMHLHGECDGDTTEGGSGSGSVVGWHLGQTSKAAIVGHCADDPANATAADRIRIFTGYLARYPGLFYAPTVTGTNTAGMPTLDQVRGHVVLTTFTGPRGQVYPGFGLTQLTDGDAGRYVENDWTQCNLDRKWAEVKANLDRANADASGAMYTTYTSASCAPFGPGPAGVAGGYFGGTGENQRTLDYLVNRHHLGVVLMDYPGHALVAAVIGAR